ncbi:MAG: hypothetical protein ABI354_02820 [Candidatus Saccharimonadales bacterium]
MPSVNKTKAKSAKPTSKVVAGKSKVVNKKKRILLSLAAVLVLAVGGYGGYYGWQKHQTQKQLGGAHSELSAHAESTWAQLARIHYMYGAIIQNDNFVAAWACRTSNSVSVLTARKYWVEGVYVVSGSSVSGHGWDSYDSQQSPGRDSNSWWGNLNLQTTSMVARNGGSAVGANSSRLFASYRITGTQRGSMGTQGYENGFASNNGDGIRTQILPYCHY